MTLLQDLRHIADCLHWSTTDIEEPETISSEPLLSTAPIFL
jgi:hypothetical protein